MQSSKSLGRPEVVLVEDYEMKNLFSEENIIINSGIETDRQNQTHKDKSAQFSKLSP